MAPDDTVRRTFAAALLLGALVFALTVALFAGLGPGRASAQPLLPVAPGEAAGTDLLPEPGQLSPPNGLSEPNGFSPTDLCRFYSPDESQVRHNLCGGTVMWSVSPVSEDYRPVVDPGNQEYCWFTGPTGESDAVRLCQEDICWVNSVKALRENSESFGPISCDASPCNFTLFDSHLHRKECGSPVCWSTSPDGGTTLRVWDCGEFEEPCWFSPPNEISPPNTKWPNLKSCFTDLFWVGPALSTPAEIVHAPSEPAELLPSSEVFAAVLEPSARIELAPPVAISAPDTGRGYHGSNVPTWLWLVLLATAGAALPLSVRAARLWRCPGR